MTRDSLGQNDVYRALLMRIRSEAYRAGARLPSCRALATELDSNPNTVHRALKALESEGIVRSVPRRGTFVTGVTRSDSHDDWLAEELARFVTRAVASGVHPDELRERLDEAVARIETRTTLLFVECNQQDVDEMSTAVQHASGLQLTGVLLDDVEQRLESAVDPVLVVPLFHLGDVRSLDTGDVPMVELAFVPNPDALVEIASLAPHVRVTVASRLPRGVDRLASIVRQYFRGEIDERLVGDEDVDLSDVELLVYNNGSRLRPDELSSAPAAIRLSVTLDGTSAATLSRRIEQARSARPVEAR